VKNLAKEILNGSISAAAELIRKVEEGCRDANDDLQALYPYTGRAYILGITGLPGSGKSTIANLLIKHYRDKGMSVGVVAVDPSSPVSSGAILGDRVRMIEHSKDREVFIKSLATRGWYGGLSGSAARIINILDAMGKDVIILETVGVGQTEVSIMNFAHTTVLVLVPEMGDYVQTIKAGVLEIGDIFVINKTDKRDPGELLVNMQSLLRNQDSAGGKALWKQQIFLTSAAAGSGFDSLTGAIDGHRKYFEEFKKTDYLIKRADQELKDEIYSYFAGYFMRRLNEDKNYGKFIKQICSRQKDPYSISQEFIAKILGIKDGSLQEK